MNNVSSCFLQGQQLWLVDFVFFLGRETMLFFIKWFLHYELSVFLSLNLLFIYM